MRKIIILLAFFLTSITPIVFAGEPRTFTDTDLEKYKDQPSHTEQDKPVLAEDLQAGRKAFIQKLIKKGYFEKVEIPGSLPYLWVKPLFYTLDFKMKERFVSVVYAYYITENSKYDIVVLYDNKTGKKIGTFSEEDGGLNLY